MVDVLAVYDWFDANREKLFQGHAGECVLIQDINVFAYYPDTETAFADAEKKGFPLGEFLVQECLTEAELASLS